MYNKILVPLDGSSMAEEAILYALELRRLSGGALTLVHVAPSATAPPARYSMVEAGTWLLRQTQMQQGAERYLEDLAARPEVAAARAEHRVINGEPGPSLVALIEKDAFDVVVMTTRRRAKLARWVLGSTADFVVQHAPVPVLLVRQTRE